MKIVNIVGYSSYRYNTYLIGFCFMDSGPIASGLAFNGYSADNVARHDRVKNVALRKIFFFTQAKVFVASWNISVQNWLKNYVYLRMLDNNKEKGMKKSVAMMFTFLASGLWHGFYPGYITSFFFNFVLTAHNQLAEPVFAPYFAGWCPDWLKKAMVTAIYTLCTMVCCLSFFLQFYEYYSFVYNQIYWCVHIGIVTTALLLVALQPKKSKKKDA